jgi:hypothetical protein
LSYLCDGQTSPKLTRDGAMRGMVLGWASGVILPGCKVIRCKADTTVIHYTLDADTTVIHSRVSRTGPDVLLQDELFPIQNLRTGPDGVCRRGGSDPGATGVSCRKIRPGGAAEPPGGGRLVRGSSPGGIEGVSSRRRPCNEDSDPSGIRGGAPGWALKRGIRSRGQRPRMRWVHHHSNLLPMLR